MIDNIHHEGRRFKQNKQIEILRKDYSDFNSVSFCVDAYNCNH